MKKFQIKENYLINKMFLKDSWQSVTAIIDYYGDNQDTLIPLAGPGHWNDPDMVLPLFSYPILSYHIMCVLILANISLAVIVLSCHC